MNNKLIIASLALLISLSAIAQSEGERVISLETTYTNQKIDPNNNNKIEIYPVPAVDYLIVEINNSTLENAEFELHSIIGNKFKITPEEISDGKYRIPVKDFATGYYFLVVKDEVSRFKKAYKFLKN